MLGVLISVLLIVMPVFLVIGAGYASVRLGVMETSVVDALTMFATRIAVPTLLFTKMASLDLGLAFNADMLISFYTGALIAATIAVGAALLAGVDAPKAIVIGFAAMFSNTVLIGLPVIQRAYDQSAAEALVGVIALHIPLLFTLAMLAMAVSRLRGGGQGGLLAALRTGVLESVQNMIMIGLALGFLFNLTGLSMPAPIDAALEIVAAAALPTALFALGGALTRYSVKAEIGWASASVALSLIVHPAIAYGLGAYVFELEPTFLRAAVVAASMPPGLNVYVFAALHRTGEGAAASAVVLGTALAVATASVWLAILGGAA